MKKLILCIICSAAIFSGCSASGTVTLPDGNTSNFSLPIWLKSIDLSLTQSTTIPSDKQTSAVKTLTFTYKSVLKDTTSFFADIIKAIDPLVPKILAK